MFRKYLKIPYCLMSQILSKYTYVLEKVFSAAVCSTQMISSHVCLLVNNGGAGDGKVGPLDPSS